MSLIENLGFAEANEKWDLMFLCSVFVKIKGLLEKTIKGILCFAVVV